MIVKYKILFRNEDKSLRSLFLTKFTVRYRANYFTEALIGGLFVFNSEVHAIDFMPKDQPYVELWLSQVKEQIELPKTIVPTYYQTWYPEGIGCRCEAQWPEGTETWRYVRPLKRLH